ncbi:hypothetical protein QE152_g12678 [Popillia japonica]|uniref:Uncharacterized protein n=1 Tax=Popillia japonica TaxID=7064 RepID=A0AAW1LQP3_POPJA
MNSRTSRILSLCSTCKDDKENISEDISGKKEVTLLHNHKKSMLEDNILQTHVDASCSVLLFQNDVLLSLKIEYSNKLSDEHTIVNYGLLAENHGTNLAVQNDINEIIDSNKSSPSNLFSKDNSSDPDFEPNSSDITDNDNSKENKLRKSRICRGRSRRAREKAKLLRNTGQAYKSKSGKTVRGRLLKGPLLMKKVNEDGVKFVWREVQWLRYSSEAPGILQYKNSLTEDEPSKGVNFKRRGRQPSTYLFMSRHHPTIEEEDQEPFESSGSEYVPSKLEKSNSDEQVAQAARLPTANGRTRKRRSKGEGDLLHCQWTNKKEKKQGRR